MTRYSFIKSVLALFGFWWTKTVGESASVPAGVNENVYLYHGYIAGYQYGEGMSIEHMLKPLDPLELRREPVNRHDCNAISIHAKGGKLGYISVKDNKILAALMDQGVKLHSSILSVDRNAESWERISFFVEIAR